jgi:hypothetical protein
VSTLLHRSGVLGTETMSDSPDGDLIRGQEDVPGARPSSDEGRAPDQKSGAPNGEMSRWGRGFA